MLELPVFLEVVQLVLEWLLSVLLVVVQLVVEELAMLLLGHETFQLFAVGVVQLVVVLEPDFESPCFVASLGLELQHYQPLVAFESLIVGCCSVAKLVILD